MIFFCGVRGSIMKFGSRILKNKIKKSKNFFLESIATVNKKERKYYSNHGLSLCFFPFFFTTTASTL